MWSILAYPDTTGVARITPGGTITVFALPQPRPAASTVARSGPPTTRMAQHAAGLPVQIGPRLNLDPGITVGADGALWFTEENASDIGRITTTGSVTEFAASANGSIVSGSDGALWFTSDQGIGRITTAGLVSYFPTRMPTDLGILKGPDGNIWFGQGDNSGDESIGRITPSGAITYVQVPSPSSLPDTGVGTVGADGSVWFGGNGSLGKISPNASPTVYSNAAGDGPMATASGGAVWFLEGGATIGRIASTGTITLFDLTPERTQYNGIVPGPNGDLWVTTYYSHGIIGRLTPPSG